MKELFQIFGMVWLATSAIFTLVYAFALGIPFGLLDVVVASTFTATFSIVYVLMQDSKDLIKH
jgi:hypothetical protein